MVVPSSEIAGTFFLVKRFSPAAMWPGCGTVYCGVTVRIRWVTLFVTLTIAHRGRSAVDSTSTVASAPAASMAPLSAMPYIR